MKHDIDFFIDKFYKIPEAEWAVGANQAESKNALEHCGASRAKWSAQSEDLIDILGHGLGIRDDIMATLATIEVNDGAAWAIRFGGTPKQRMLAILSAIKRKKY